jgi:hypothetical protein
MAYETIVRLLKAEPDNKINDLVRNAQETLDGHGNRTWLVWAKVRLMPETMWKVEEEIAEAVHVEKEHRETADREAREVEEHRRREREDAQVAKANEERERKRKELLERLMNGELDADTFQAATEALDKRNDAEEPQETREDKEHVANVGEGVKDNRDDENAGEPEVTVAEKDNDDDLAIVGERRAGKQKRTEMVGNLQDVAGKVRKLCGLSLQRFADVLDAFRSATGVLL